MPEPITIAATAATVAEATTAAKAIETTAAAKLLERTAASAISVADELAAANASLAEAETAGGLSKVGGTTEAFVNSLNIPVDKIGESVLAHAENSGRVLTRELGSSGLDIGSKAKEAPATVKLDAKEWLEMRPPEGVVQPEVLVERSRWLNDPDNLKSLIPHLENRNPVLAREISRRVEQLRNARGPAERDAVLTQIKKTTAGLTGECSTAELFRPFFESVKMQQRVNLPGGGSTIIDVRLTGARHSLVLGHGLNVPKNGNLSIEVKIGQPGYIGAQSSHISSRQVPGHLELGDRSLVVVSREGFLNPSLEQNARHAVKAAGSDIRALLPEKALIDDALIRIIGERARRPV